MWRHISGVRLGFVAFHHDVGELADAGREFFRIQKLCGHRIDVAEIVDIFAERRTQLVELAIARSRTDQHLEPQPALARLTEKQCYVRIVANMRDDVGRSPLSLVTSAERSGAAAE